MSIEAKRLTLESLAPGSIVVTTETVEGVTTYGLSFNDPNTNWGRVITSHTDEASAEEKLQEYIAFLEGQGTTPIVPQKVTSRQMRVALIMSGFSIETINAMINGLPEPTKSIAFQTWDYSNEFHRSNALLNSLAPALGLSQEQLDNLFKLAITL